VLARTSMWSRGLVLTGKGVPVKVKGLLRWAGEEGRTRGRSPFWEDLEGSEPKIQVKGNLSYTGTGIAAKKNMVGGQRVINQQRRIQTSRDFVLSTWVGDEGNVSPDIGGSAHEGHLDHPQ